MALGCAVIRREVSLLTMTNALSLGVIVAVGTVDSVVFDFSDYSCAMVLSDGWSTNA